MCHICAEQHLMQEADGARDRQSKAFVGSAVCVFSPKPLLRPVAFSTMMRALMTFPNLEKRRNKASLVMVLGMWKTNRLQPSGPAKSVPRWSERNDAMT